MILALGLSNRPEADYSPGPEEESQQPMALAEMEAEVALFEDAWFARVQGTVCFLTLQYYLIYYF